MRAPSSLQVPGGWPCVPRAPKTHVADRARRAELVRDAEGVADEMAPDRALEALGLVLRGCMSPA